MDSIKRIKGYGRTSEYKLVFKEKVNKPTYITHINTIVKSQPYLDFVDEIEVHGICNEVVTRKVYAKNSYAEIVNKQMSEYHRYKLVRLVQVDRDKLVDYIKETNKYFKIIGQYNDIVTVELYDIVRKEYHIADTSKSDKQLKNEDYTLLSTHTGPYNSIMDKINNSTPYYLEYVIQYKPNKYSIWGRYCIDEYMDRYVHHTSNHIEISGHSHTNPYFIIQYLKNNLGNNLFNIQCDNFWYRVTILNTCDKVMNFYDEEIQKAEATLAKLKEQKAKVKDKIIKQQYEYWYINEKFQPVKTTYNNTDEDKYRSSIGNCFQDYDKCKEACHKILNLF